MVVVEMAGDLGYSNWFTYIDNGYRGGMYTQLGLINTKFKGVNIILLAG